MNPFRSFCLLLTIVVLPGVIYGQDQDLADSLKSVYYNEKPTDSLELSILYQIAFNETDPELTRRYADLLIEKSTLMDNGLYLYRGFLQKGYSAQYRGDYDEAFDAFFISLEKAYAIDYKPGVAGAYTAMADSYSLMGDSRNAMEYYNRAIATFRTLNDSTFLASVLLNAGDEYFNANKLDSALIYFEESGAIFDKINYEVGQAYNMGNVGLVYAKLGKYDSAESYLNEATKMLEQLGDVYPIAVYNFYLADIYFERGEVDRAISYGQMGYQIGKLYGLKEQIKEGAEKLSHYYEAKGYDDEALKFLREYIVLRDSIRSTEVIQEMADLQRKFEVAQKQIEVDLLNQEKRTQQVIGIALVIILALTVIVVVSLYRTNQRKKKLNHQLQLLNETKDRFFSIISHDLRGPISAFYGISRMIKMFIQKKQYQSLEAMTEQIDESVSSISSLLDNLLSWAVQQQGHFPYHPAIVDLHELAENLRHIVKPSADAKQIKVILEIQAGSRLWVDKNSTMTILRNLTSNAIKFTPEGGTITISSRVKKETISVQVRDTGIGIPKEDMENIFALNDRKSTYGTSGEKGLGLGLQLVFEFTQLNKGEISVESEEGVGTTFTVELPKADSLQHQVEPIPMTEAS